MKQVPAGEINNAGRQDMSPVNAITSWADALYYILYFIGMRIIRYSRRTRRRTRIGLLHFKWFVKRKILDFQEIPRTSRLARELRLEVTIPIREMKTRFEQRKLSKALAKQAGETLPKNLSVSWAIAPLEKPLTLMINWLLPVCGILILMITVQIFGSMTFALRVEYNGEFSGYVLSEGQLDTALSQVRDRMINESGTGEQIASYTLEPIDVEQLTDVDVLVNNLIQASGIKVEEATGLYVSNRFMGAVLDGDALLMDLKNLKEAERAAVGDDATVSFVQDVKVAKGLYPASSIAEVEDIHNKLTAVVKGQRTITIKEGDSPWTISQDVGIPVDTLVALNPEVSKTMLIGEPFIVSVDQLFLQKKVEKTIVEDREIQFETEKEVDKNKASTYSEVVQEGSNGLEQVVSKVTIIDGYETDRTVVERKVVREPVNAKIVTGSLTAAVYNFDTSSFGGTKTGGYIWPVNGGYISCPINGYPGHTGTDIAAPAGTAIYAARDGVVTYAGWSRSYGYNVVIQHADGYKTRYAHCSKLATVTGASVKQGQQIAYVGRTGNATGNHCHFEIFSSNTGFINASMYIGYSR